MMMMLRRRMEASHSSCVLSERAFEKTQASRTHHTRIDALLLLLLSVRVCVCTAAGRKRDVTKAMMLGLGFPCPCRAQPFPRSAIAAFVSAKASLSPHALRLAMRARAPACKTNRAFQRLGWWESQAAVAALSWAFRGPASHLLLPSFSVRLAHTRTQGARGGQSSQPKPAWRTYRASYPPAAAAQVCLCVYACVHACVLSLSQRGVESLGARSVRLGGAGVNAGPAACASLPACLPASLKEACR